MLVNPSPHLSHTLSSIQRECVYAWNKIWKKKLSQGGDSGGGMIGPRNAAQSKLCVLTLKKDKILTGLNNV